MCDVPDIPDIPIIGDIIDVIVDIVENVVSWLIPIPDIPDYGDLNQDAIARGVLVNKTAANASIPIIYGTRKVGGIIVFAETSGTDNEFLYMALVLGEGKIDDITEIYVNDRLVTWSADIADNTQITVNSSDSNYFKAPDADSSAESLITVEPHFGSDDQTASSLLTTLNSWGPEHRLRGLAYLALKFKWNSDAFGSLPVINAVVKGKKVYNPNLDGTKTGGSGSHREDTSSTWAYSDNPVYQLLDYLRNTRFGMGISNSYFDSNYAEWQTAGDICDADITPYTGANAIDLMDSNIVVDTSRKAIDNVKEFLKGCRGILNYTAGAYKILVETTGSAAITLTEDNIIGGIQISSKNKNSRFNRVIVSFINPDKNYQSDEVQFPPVNETGLASADQHANLLSEDGGILLEGRFDFSMFTNPYQAQEMAEIILRRSRSSLDVSIKADGTATDLQIGDIVNVTHATPSFSAKPFRVQAMTINADSTVNLTLSEHQDSYYTFGTQQEVATIPDTTLPNPFVIEAPSVANSDELISLFDGSVVSKLTVVVNSNDKFVNEYEVQIKPSGDTNFVTIGRSSNKVFEKYPVIEGETYDIRARSINSLGVSSSFTTSQHEINSAFDPPDDVTNYSVDVVGDKVHHNWSPVTNLDLRFYEIRMSTDTTKTNYADTVVLVERIGRPSTSVVTPYQAGVKYFIKAVDKFGIRSTNFASSIVTEQVFAEKQSSIQTITEEPLFSGTKSNCVVVDSKLRLDTALFESVSGNFDDAEGFFDGGDGTIVTSGTYDFNTAIDLGAKFKSNVHLKDLIVQNINFINNFDSKKGLFDSAEGLFDGGQNASVDTNVELQVATSDNNVSFGNFQTFKSGDFNSRALKFRAVLTSSNAEETPEISNMSLIVSLQKRSEEGSNISSGTDTAGKTITYTNPFYQIPTLTVIAQNLQTGDFFNINSKSKTAFNVEFFDSGGNTVNRTFDYQLIGIGQQQ